jgi:hypothetical protein
MKILFGTALSAAIIFALVPTSSAAMTTGQISKTSQRFYNEVKFALPKPASTSQSFEIQQKGTNKDCRCVWLKHPDDATVPGSQVRREKCWARFKCGL